MADLPPSPDKQSKPHLPTLADVLARRTAPPVDLFSFYIYMRDDQQAVDYLDFWLDVEQHFLLCRHYVSGLRRSAMVATPDIEEQTLEKQRAMSDQAVSIYLRDNPAETSRSGVEEELEGHRAGITGTPRHRDSVSSTSRLTDNTIDHPRFAGAMSSGMLPLEDHRSSQEFPLSDGEVDRASSSLGVVANAEPMAHPDDPNRPTREDLYASAEKILYTYLAPDSEREIILPSYILDPVTNSVTFEHRDDPEVFDEAKDFVFQAMERDAFRGFLRARVLGNLVRSTLMFYAIAGFLSLFAALWASFVLIFLNHSRSTRCWLILPFTLASYFLVAHQYKTDPILAIVGLSEYPAMTFHKIKDSLVHKMLIKRAITVLVTVALIDAALCSLFIFVPGKRL